MSFTAEQVLRGNRAKAEYSLLLKNDSRLALSIAYNTSQ